MTPTVAALRIASGYWRRQMTIRYAVWKRTHGAPRVAAHRLYDVAVRKHHEYQVRISAATGKPTHTSNAAVTMIADFEGYFAHPYNDPVGYATVGYGHLIATRPVNQADRDRWGTLTKAEAMTLLQADLGKDYEPAVRRLGLTRQGQFDAMVSFVYNLGVGLLAPSHTIGAALARHDYRAAADAILLYDKAGSPPRALPGLTRRREAERRLFLS